MVRPRGGAALTVGVDGHARARSDRRRDAAQAAETRRARCRAGDFPPLSGPGAGGSTQNRRLKVVSVAGEPNRRRKLGGSLPSRRLSAAFGSARPGRERPRGDAGREFPAGAPSERAGPRPVARARSGIGNGYRTRTALGYDSVQPGQIQRSATYVRAPPSSTPTRIITRISLVCVTNLAVARSAATSRERIEWVLRWRSDRDLARADARIANGHSPIVPRTHGDVTSAAIARCRGSAGPPPCRRG